MTLTSQQYAGLAEDAYEPRSLTGDNARIRIDDTEFKVLAQASNQATGYQGTIYERVGTSEIVVAHRGTEGNRGLDALLQDGVRTDGGMVLARANIQAKDAIDLTKVALGFAEARARDGRSHEVTVTGHSLGGCLAQITAHHFGLRGETFNAYGAASLDRRIPEGGNSVINHVTALDSVSAASPHFGEVRIYARPDEILALRNTGYENDASVLDVRSIKEAVRRGLGSHSMHHFLGVDGAGRPDRSVLSDPTARELAERYAPMIGKFRDDVGYTRAAITLGSRSVSGHLSDLMDEIRGPLQPGVPASRERQYDHDSHHFLRMHATDSRGARIRPLVPDSPHKPEFQGRIESDPVGFLDRMIAADKAGQSEVLRHMTQDLANLDPGREQRAEAAAAVDRAEVAAAQQAQEAQHQERTAPRRAISH